MKYIVCPDCSNHFPDTESRCPQCGLEMIAVEPKEEKPTLSILALIFAFLGPGVGLILSIIGITKSTKDSNRSRSKIALFFSILMAVINTVFSWILASTGFYDIIAEAIVNLIL